MGARLRGVAVVAVVLAVGAFLGSAFSQWWRAAPVVEGSGAESPARVEAPVGRRVRVEVLNGGGREGMARAATDRLRDSGFDVVYYGNASTFDRDTSVVFDRVGEPALAERVAAALGIRSVRAEPDSNLYLEVSVVLGADWDPPPARAGSATDSAEIRAWWDLRRLFRKSDPGAGGAGSGPPGRMVDPGEKGND